jgi:L-malate glycosyltransferase
MKKKILFVHHLNSISGGEITLLEILKFISKNLFSPIVVLSKPGDLSIQLEKIGIKIVYIQLSSLKLNSIIRSSISFIKTIFQIWVLIKKENISMIHAFSSISTQYSVIAAKLAKIPCISHIHLILDSKSIFRSFIKYSDKIFTISNATQKPLLSYGISPQKIFLLYQFTDTDLFQKKNIYNQKQQKQNNFIIGVVGRICYEKGHHNAIETVFILKQLGFTNIELHIVGYTNLMEKEWDTENYIIMLKKIIKKYNLEKNIIFHNFKNNMVPVYSSFDILILPNEWQEPFGKVIIEAMAMRLPVIAVNSGACPEIITHKKTGFLYPQGNNKSLANYIKILITNRKIIHKFGLEGRKRVVRHFSLKKKIKDLESAYDELFKKK